jgi:hypothetical protein
MLGVGVAVLSGVKDFSGVKLLCVDSPESESILAFPTPESVLVLPTPESVLVLPTPESVLVLPTTESMLGVPKPAGSRDGVLLLPGVAIPESPESALWNLPLHLQCHGNFLQSLQWPLPVLSKLDLSSRGSSFSSLSFSSFFLSRTSLTISTGKSATPIIRLPMVPSRADAPPEMGSQGPSSTSYSLGRYL